MQSYLSNYLWVLGCRRSRIVCDEQQATGVIQLLKLQILCIVFIDPFYIWLCVWSEYPHAVYSMFGHTDITLNDTAIISLWDTSQDTRLLLGSSNCYSPQICTFPLYCHHRFRLSTFHYNLFAERGTIMNHGTNDNGACLLTSGSQCSNNSTRL